LPPLWRQLATSATYSPTASAAAPPFYDRVRVDFDQTAEWLVADALQLGPLECIVNSGSIMQLAPQLVVTQINGRIVIAQDGRDCKTFGVTPDHGRCIDDQ
jgi:hypothetical protein